MTVEERAKEYSESYSREFSCGGYLTTTEDDLYDAYLAGATDDKWVSVKDILPEIEGEYLVALNQYKQFSIERIIVHRRVDYLTWLDYEWWVIEGDRKFTDAYVDTDFEITHWHPLPSLPPTGNKSL